MSAATLPRKRRGYSRDDVTTHHSGCGWPEGGAPPAVNVKVYLWGDAFPDAVLRDVAEDCGEDPARFEAWWRAKAEERTGEGWNDGTALGELLDGRDGYGWSYEAARDAFEDCEEWAREAFPDHSPRVEQGGRSGGWLELAGLPPVSEWDAVMLGRWRRFERMVRAEVEDFPRRVAWLICANVYAHERAEEDAERARQVARGRAIVGAWADLYAGRVAS